MPDADQPVASRPGAQPVQLLRHVRRGEVDPSDDPGDQVGLPRHSKELRRLVDVVQHLDQHRGVHPGRSGHRTQVRGPEVAPDHLQVRPVEPVLRPGREVPQVVVGVDPAHRGHA
nr:hypothetical protein [Lentzea indica]